MFRYGFKIDVPSGGSLKNLGTLVDYRSWMKLTMCPPLSPLFVWVKTTLSACCRITTLHPKKTQKYHPAVTKTATRLLRWTFQGHSSLSRLFVHFRFRLQRTWTWTWQWLEITSGQEVSRLFVWRHENTRRPLKCSICINETGNAFFIENIIKIHSNRVVL